MVEGIKIKIFSLKLYHVLHKKIKKTSLKINKKLFKIIKIAKTTHMFKIIKIMEINIFPMFFEYFFIKII